MQTAPTQLIRSVRAASAPAIVGGIAVVIVAVLLFTRFSIHGALNRDESIYAYGGQQLADGVAPYVSIFDPKAPLATLLSGLGAAIGRLFGHSELSGIRALFCLLSVLSVLAIYLLALQLWKAVSGAIVAAVVFASFYRFAADALGGPDAKTAALLPIVLCMYFAARRQWFRAGLFAGVAVVAWQPLFTFVLVIFVLAPTLGDPVTTPATEADGVTDADTTAADATPALTARTPHWRALARAAVGAAIPVALVVVYFIAAGAWGKLIEATVQFPLFGAQPPNRTLRKQISSIADVVHSQYKFSAALFWAGTILIIVFVVTAFVRNRAAPLEALKDPVVNVVAFSWILQVGYMLYDFEGGPDIFPVLPAPALCLGGLFATVVHAFRGNARRVAAGVALVAAVALAVEAWAQFTRQPGHGLNPETELAEACGLQRTLSTTGRLWVIGNPVPLVLTRRTNPDRFIYMGEGADAWKVKHTEGGFEGWMAQIAAVAPTVVLIDDFAGEYALDTAKWLRAHNYSRYFIGDWKVFVLPGIRTDALTRGVQLTRRPTKHAIDENGARLPTQCPLPRVG